MRTISQPLLTFLLNACWQIALITAIAAFCAWLLRGTTARYQHLLWVTALAFSFGLPVLTCASLLGGAFISEPQRTTIQPSDEALAPATQLVPDTQSSLPTTPPAALEETAPFIRINRNVAAVMVVLYLLFLCYRSGKLFMAWMKARSLKRGACLIELPEHVRAIVSECQSVLGVRQVQVLCSTSIPAPVAVGSFNPLIILPEQLFKETDRGVLTAAIGHELVHVMRRDYLLNLIYELISLPLSFHPATALVKRRIRETRELGCDELVTEKLLDAAVYARSLVHLAGSAINLSRPGATITVGVADADILEERVMTILRRPKTITRRRNLLLVATALIFVVPCVAAAPFALRIGINPQSAAVAPESTVVTVQQDASQELKPKVIYRVRKERKSKEAEEVRVKRTAEKVRTIQDAKKLEPELKKRVTWTIQDAKKLEPELKKQDREILGERKPKYKLIAIGEPDNKSNIAELAKKANITMQQAIQIAMSQQPGTVMQCRLIGEKLAGERDQVFYNLTMVSADEPKSASTTMLISAADGRVVRTWKNKR
jgi:beta-lactamase regulating signal transducer with metallopeptidase domain/uncharacterized membrane protein YkoI